MFLQTRLYYAMRAMMHIRLCYRDKGIDNCTAHLMRGVKEGLDLSEQFLSFLYNVDRPDFAPVTAITAHVYEKFGEVLDAPAIGDKELSTVWSTLFDWETVGIPCFQVLGYAEPEKAHPSTLYVPGQGYVHWMFPFAALEIPNGCIGLFSDKDLKAYEEALQSVYADVEIVPYTLLEGHKTDTDLDAAISEIPEMEEDARRERRALSVCGLWKKA